MTDLTALPTPSLAMILGLQAELAQLPQADLEVVHHFSKGVYARELRLPAGVVAVGKMHATEHLLIIAQGDISITTERGTERLLGPMVINSMPGIKRAAFAHEDTTVITIHVTEETDLVAIEQQVILPDPLPVIEEQPA